MEKVCEDKRSYNVTLITELEAGEDPTNENDTTNDDPEFEKNCGSKNSKTNHTGKIKTLRKISTIKRWNLICRTSFSFSYLLFYLNILKTEKIPR